jgi:outer membrane protein OmpA-like peptidoglycan-associated protein
VVEDYNTALGERRANAVKEYLVNQGVLRQDVDDQLWRNETRDA